MRQATLRVVGHPVSGARAVEVRSQLRVEVVSGPLLAWQPESLLVVRDANGAQPGHRTVVLMNAGHFDLRLQQMRVSGVHAGRFVTYPDRPLPLVLPPGDYLDLRVEYLPECDGSYGTATSSVDHEATLAVASDGGTAVLPLAGASEAFCPP
jgi:hypothetical protein